MDVTKLALCGTHHMRRTHECRLYIIFLPAKSSNAGPTWTAAYNDSLPEKGLSKGFNSTAPVMVMARRVVQASKVAAPLEAMIKPFQTSCLRRFSARSSSILTVNGLAGFRKGIGAGGFRAAMATGASGKTAAGSTAG